MRNLIGFLLLIIGISPILLFGQKWKTSMYMPQKYFGSTLSSQQFNQNDLLMLSDRPWEVYSVNPSSKSTNEPFGEIIPYDLQFMEKFYVVETKGPYIHIVKDELIDITGNLSRSTFDFGWIHQNDLLLTNHSIVNEIGQPILAVACDNISKRIQKINYSITLTNNDAKVYYDSELTLNAGINLIIGDLYFVYKTNEKSALIGVSDRIDSKTYKSDILGWISLENLMLWDERLAIEPNWELEACNERKTKNITANLFFDPISASLYAGEAKSTNQYSIWSSDQYENRWPGKYLRFPVKGYNGNILKVGIWGQTPLPLINSPILEPLQHIYTKNSFLQFLILRDYSQNNLINIPDNNIENQNPNLIYTEAFTAYYHESLRFPLFKYVYLLTRNELITMLDFYRNIQFARQDDITLYYFLMNELLKIDAVTNPTEFESIPIDIVLRKLSKIPINYNFFGTFKLMELNNLDRKLKDRIEVLNQKIDQLLKLLNQVQNQTDYPFSFTSNNTVYYWIPLDSLL